MPSLGSPCKDEGCRERQAAQSNAVSRILSEATMQYTVLNAVSKTTGQPSLSKSQVLWDTATKSSGSDNLAMEKDLTRAILWGAVAKGVHSSSVSDKILAQAVRRGKGAKRETSTSDRALAKSVLWSAITKSVENQRLAKSVIFGAIVSSVNYQCAAKAVLWSAIKNSVENQRLAKTVLFGVIARSVQRQCDVEIAKTVLLSAIEKSVENQRLANTVLSGVIARSVKRQCVLDQTTAKNPRLAKFVLCDAIVRSETIQQERAVADRALAQTVLWNVIWRSTQRGCISSERAFAQSLLHQIVVRNAQTCSDDTERSLAQSVLLGAVIRSAQRCNAAAEQAAVQSFLQGVVLRCAQRCNAATESAIAQAVLQSALLTSVQRSERAAVQSVLQSAITRSVQSCNAAAERAITLSVLQRAITRGARNDLIMAGNDRALANAVVDFQILCCINRNDVEKSDEQGNNNSALSQLRHPSPELCSKTLLLELYRSCASAVKNPQGPSNWELLAPLCLRHCEPVDWWGAGCACSALRRLCSRSEVLSFWLTDFTYGARAEVLQLSAQCGILSLLRPSIRAGADVNHIFKGAWLRTPLHHAASRGHDFTVEALLALRADPLAQDVDGNTPVHLAASKGREDVAKVLLRACPESALLADYGGRTPAHRAALRGNLNVMRQLIACRASVLAEAHDGTTPLVIARRRKSNIALLRFLEMKAQQERSNAEGHVEQPQHVIQDET